MNKVNMLLTEIALNLLGNTFYNINGYPVEDLASLFKLDENDQCVSTNEKHLKEVLQLDPLDQSGELAETLESDDDDVVHVDIPQQVINLEDDDSENEDSSTSQAESSSQSSSQQKASPSSGCNNSNRSFSSASLEGNYDQEKEKHNGASFTSSSESIRLDYFKREVKLEYERMMNNSEKQKLDYLSMNRHMLTILKLSEKDLMKRFHSDQKQQLCAEIHTLMQFIRIVKTNDRSNQHTISHVAKDILAAKNNILK